MLKTTTHLFVMVLILLQNYAFSVTLTGLVKKYQDLMQKSDFFAGPKGLNKEETEALAQALSENSNIKHLSFKNPDNALVLAIANALKKNNTIQSLSLYHSIGLNKSSMTALAEALTVNKNLKTLLLQENQLQSFMLEDFWKILENNKILKELDLSGNLLKDLKGLKEFLHNNNTLKMLALGDNEVSESGFKQLALGLKQNQTLTNLFLAQNYNLSENILKAFAEALKLNNSLQTLKLSFGLEKQFAKELEKNKR